MKKRSKWIVPACTLALVALCGGAALAATGDQNDPLITKSYLEQTAIPSVVTQVETKMAARQEALSKALGEQIEQYKKDVAALGSAGSGSHASYTLVTLAKGQTLSMELGCEVLLRVGTATASASSAPALINISTGETLNSGASLTKNHLYMATIAQRTISPTADTVKLLVRGGYSVA